MEGRFDGGCCAHLAIQLGADAKDFKSHLGVAHGWVWV